MIDKRVCSCNERINELLRIKNLTQKAFCDITGIPTSNLSLYVNKKRMPKQRVITQICDTFNVAPAWLMGYDVPMTPTLSDEVAKALPKDMELKRKAQINTLVEVSQSLDARGLDTVIACARFQEEFFQKPS